MAEEQNEMPTAENTETSMGGAGVQDNGPPPRLIIQKIEMENFKSYGGIKEIGPFHKCFSSVVGPNGSGKSNVIDAMLFVFGKRAKKLRLNKVSELIHKSDAVKNNPPTSARVSVFFEEIIDHGEGDNDFDVVPNTRRVVTRVAKKDNSSQYKLDGRNCSFREVAAYLGSKGIDLDNNRFLILQGEVEMISMMPPKGKTEDDDGLLEYLEDIIGSVKYVEQTNIAAQKVEQLTEQRQEKLNRVKAVEKEKDNLEGAKQEAEALLNKDREIRRKRNILLQIGSMKETKTIEKLTQEKDEAEEKLGVEKEKMSEAKSEVKELEDALKTTTKEYQKICEELTTTKEEFKTYERRHIKLESEIKHAKDQMKKAKAKVAAETKKEEEAMQKGQEAEESIPGLEEQCSQLAEQKAEEDRKLDGIQEEVNNQTKDIRAALEEKQEELTPFNQELSEIQNNIDTTQTEIKLLEDQTSSNKKRLQDSEAELAALDGKQKSKREELAKCERDLEEGKARLKEIDGEEQQLNGKIDSLKQKAMDLTARAEEAKAALHAGGQGGGSRVVKAILQAAKSGELKSAGVLGRLGDLCTTTAEYDAAVSNAGGMWDFIVVRTTAGAQKCVEYLRKHKLGRGHFLPLDKQKKAAHNAVVTTPENAPRLFDQIIPSHPEIAPAIFVCVGNTLVAPDMDTASRWAYDFGKRWRVITLNGNLIETSGAMQGGGRSVIQGKIKISNGTKLARSVPLDQATEENCKKLEAEAQKANELLNQCRQRLKELGNERRNLQSTLKSTEQKLPRLRLEIASCDTTRENLTKLIPELRTKCELSTEEKAALKELQKKEQKFLADLASCQKQAEKLQAEVDALKKSILEAGGKKLKKQENACKKIDEDLNEAQTSLNAAKVAITSNKKAAAKAKKQKEAAEKTYEECSELVSEKEEEHQGMQQDAEAVKEAYEAVKKLEAEKKEELAASKKECDELSKKLAAARVVEIELIAKVDECNQKLSDCKVRKKQLSKQMQKLQKEAEDDDDFDASDDEDDAEEETGEKEPVDEDGDVEMEAAEESDKPQKEPKEVAQPKSSLPTISFEVLERYNVDDIKGAIETLESERNTLAKNANMGAIEEYRKKEADYLARVAELDQVTEERNACRREHDELRRKRLEMFMDGFGKITLKLKEMYQMITLGGDAELELVDSLDPFSEGIVFSVRPPKKSWKNISNLSGGEKTLSSLALVFALHHYKPTPLYVMDEIDAALDFKNVSIVANYIKERTKDAQFIIISLRNNMFELADRLVGIYKVSNTTNSITIDPKAFAVASNQNGATTTPRRSTLGDKTNRADQTAAELSKRSRSMNTGGSIEAETFE